MADPNIHSLLASAVHWLLKDRKCALITTEQAIINECRSDVLGCELSGKVLEIEIKTALQDMKHNIRKHSLEHRRIEGTEPSLFYFLVVPSIAEQAEKYLQPGQGMLVPVITDWYAPCVRKLRVVRAAEENPAARILTTDEMLSFAVKQSRRYVAALASVALLNRKEPA